MESTQGARYSYTSAEWMRPRIIFALLRIFERVIRLRADSYLILAGLVEARAVFNNAHARWPRRLGIAGRVIFAGIRSDAPRLLGAADLMIFPSLREGLPGAVLEAVAAGTPVLASDLPCILEISEHLVTVECLPLSQPDEIWAESAIRIIAKCANTPDGGAAFQSNAIHDDPLRRAFEAL